MMKLTIIALIIAAIVAGVVTYGALHWRTQTRALHARLVSTRTLPARQSVHTGQPSSGTPASA